MEDDPDAKKIKINKKHETEIIYKVDLTQPQFLNIYERIQRIFDGNYLNFIRSIKDPIIKEIYVLLRKYQYFFTKLELNSTVIFDFSRSSDCVLNSVNMFYKEDAENYFTFFMSILPKFKKNELNFDISDNDDLLRCQFKIFFEKNSKEAEFILIPNKTKVEITNISKGIESVVYNILTDSMSDILNSFLADYKENLIQGLNKFLTYVENYFPEIHKKVFEKHILQMDIWSQEEQDKLEEAVLKFQGEKNVKVKFRKIAEFVRTKTFAECVNRYKKLASLKKSADNSSEQGNEESEKEISNKNEQIKEPMEANKNTTSKIQIENEDNSKKKNKEIKIHVNKIEPSEKQPEKEIIKQPELIIIPKQNTADLVDDIINQFNALYGDIKLENSTPNDELNHQEVYYKEEGIENEEEENSENSENSLEEEIDEMYLKNESKNKSKNTPTTSEQINFFNPESTSLKTSISPQHLQLIRNIFKMGDKHCVNLSGLILKNIALGEISEPKLFLRCGKCKKVAFESHFLKLNKKLNIFYMGVLCPKCSNEMQVMFKSELLHPGNLTLAGVIFSVGVIILDILPSTYLINCLKCPDTYKKVSIRTGGILVSQKKCVTCGDELTFHIYTAGILQTTYTDFSFLENFEVNNFQKINHHIQDEESLANYVKKYDKIIQVGNPLPDKGTCRHYKQSFRWFRFGCCAKIYPCDVCHDEGSSHEAEYARTILCGHCAFEQSSQNPICSKCGKSFCLEDSGRGFWEGGKGCRNKLMMSGKDNHKFKNSDSKTVSRKKRELLNNKNV